MNRSPAVAVIHPDHLLDRARAARHGLAGLGALPPEDWQRLGAHLSVCQACAWEQAATDDFARARASAAGDLDPARLDGLIDGALARAGFAPVLPAALLAEHVGAAPSVVVLRPARFAARRLAAAAMVAAAIGAAMALPARAPREGPHADPQLTAASEASLDAGALGAPSGGDS